MLRIGPREKKNIAVFILFFSSSPKDMFADFRERGREKERRRKGREEGGEGQGDRERGEKET